jgi:hypothetical protein
MAQALATKQQDDQASNQQQLGNTETHNNDLVE